MKPHWHKEFEIIRVVSGLFEVHLGGVQYTLSSGDIMLVDCGMLHRGEPTDCVYECLVFDPNMLRRRQNDAVNPLITPLINGTSSVNCVIPQKGSGAYLAAGSLLGVVKNKEKFFELETYSLIFRLFAMLYKENMISSISKNTQIDKKNQTVIKLLEWIEENYTENISLNQLSRISNLSEKYLCRIFKEYTSKTPINYINELRIDAACHEIAVKHKNITEAALSCGFNDLSYFSKTFKKYKNISPNQFKKSLDFN